MVERGRVAERFYEDLVLIVSSRSATDGIAHTPTPSAPAKKGAPSGGVDTMFALNQGHMPLTFRALRQPLKRSLASFAADPSPTPPAASARPADNFAALASSPAGVPLGSLTSPFAAEQYATEHEVQLAAFQTRVATTPGQHGVPFETPRCPPSRGRVSTASAPGAALTAASPAIPRPGAGTTLVASSSSASSSTVQPSTAAPKHEIRDYLREMGICFQHAIGGSCRRSNCRWRHDLVPSGAYQSAFPPDVYRGEPRRQGGQPRGAPRRVLAAMTPMDYEEAVSQGLVLQDGLPEAAAAASAEDGESSAN